HKEEIRSIGWCKKMMGGFIEIKQIKNDKRKKQVKEAAKTIGKGASSILKTIGKGVKKLADDIQERQKPENQLKRLKTQKELLAAKADVMKEQEKINKLKPKVDSSTGLGGFVDNANKNMNELFGDNIFNNKGKKNNGGILL
ncbi:unnamed protein product, partial [marine sediment metagenome]